MRFGSEPAGAIGSLLGALAPDGGDPYAAARSSSLYATVTELIPSGTTALIAETGEYAVEVIDTAMGQLGGAVARQATAGVETDVQFAKEAHRAAEKEARQRERDELRSEHEASRTKHHNESIDTLNAGIDRVEAFLESQKSPEQLQK